MFGCTAHSDSEAGAVLGIFIWVGQSKAKEILGKPTGMTCVGIMGMTRGCGGCFDQG